MTVVVVAMFQDIICLYLQRQVRRVQLHQQQNASTGKSSFVFVVVVVLVIEVVVIVIVVVVVAMVPDIICLYLHRQVHRVQLH